MVIGAVETRKFPVMGSGEQPVETSMPFVNMRTCWICKCCHDNKEPTSLQNGPGEASGDGLWDAAWKKHACCNSTDIFLF